MDQLEVMIQAVDFIEDNLQEPIQVADMADAVSYSLYHFSRTFNSVIHHTPYDYLMRRRLSESAHELIVSDRKIIDIAFEYCFNNPETFSRAFKRMFGVQPNRWRKEQSPMQTALENITFNQHTTLSRLTAAHIRHINQGNYLQPELVEKDSFTVAGLMVLVKDFPADILQLVSLLEQVLASTHSELPSNVFYGITTYPNAYGYFYLLGIQIDQHMVDMLPPELVLKTIPRLRYARFVHKGPYQDFDLTRDYVYQTWLPQSSQQTALPLEIMSFGPPEQLQPAHLAASTVEWSVYLPIA